MVNNRQVNKKQNMAKRSGRSNVKVEGKRYSATVEKGPAAWKREWSGFISGVQMRDEGASVKLPNCMDWGESTDSSFSYLFGTPAQKKAERMRKEKEQAEKVNEQKKKNLLERKQRRLEAVKSGDDAAVKAAELEELENEILDITHSKMQRAVITAEKKGIVMDESMNRAKRRELLRLRKTKQQEEAEEHQKALKPHELLDPKLAWYQQGPYPLDELSERLVTKKAIKHGKQQGLKYNYLVPHPSWLAARRRKRAQNVMVGLGSRVTFLD